MMRVGWREALLMAAFAFICLFCATSLRNSNTITRIGLSHSIVSRGALDIDPVARDTIDKASWKGHYYCDKSPGISLMCVPAVWVADRVADAAGFPAAIEPNAPLKQSPRYALCAIACLFSATILISALALVVFWRALRREGLSERLSAAMTLLLAFGTPIFTWSTAVFGHATAGALLAIGFAQGCGRPHPLPMRRLAIGGFAIAAAMLVDLTAAPPGLMIVAFLLTRGGTRPLSEVVRRAIPVAVSALPAAVVLLVYNQLAFGSPFHLGYGSVEGFQGMKVGFFGVGVPSPGVLWQITFGSERGLFQLSPVLLAGVAAIVILMRPTDTRAIAITCAGIVLFYLTLNSGYYYWNGGYSLGPRHLTPMAPFLVFPLGLWLARLRDSPIRRVVGVLGVLSVAIEMLATIVAFRLPDDGTTMWGDHILPNLLGGQSFLALATVGTPFWLMVGVPVLTVVALAAILLRIPAPARAEPFRKSPVRP